MIHFFKDPLANQNWSSKLWQARRLAEERGVKIKTVPVAAKNDLLACWLLLLLLLVAYCLLLVGCWLLLIVCWLLLLLLLLLLVGCWSLMKLIVIYFSTILKVAADLSTFDFGVNCWILEVFSRNALMEIQGVEVTKNMEKPWGWDLIVSIFCHLTPTVRAQARSCSVFFDETMKHLVLEASSWLDSTVPLYLPSRNTFTYKSVQYIRCTLQRLRLCDLEVGLKDGHPKMSQTHESHMNFTKNSQEQMICGWSEVKFTVPSSFQFQKSRLTHSRVFCWTVLEKFTGWNMKYFPQETSQNQSPRSLQSLQLATQTPTSTLCRWSPGGGLVVVEAFSREQLKYNTGGPPDEERLVSCASRKPKQMWIHGIEDWLKVEVYLFLSRYF